MEAKIARMNGLFSFSSTISFLFNTYYSIYKFIVTRYSIISWILHKGSSHWKIQNDFYFATGTNYSQNFLAKSFNAKFLLEFLFQFSNYQIFKTTNNKSIESLNFLFLKSQPYRLHLSDTCPYLLKPISFYLKRRYRLNRSACEKHMTPPY